MAIQLSDYPTLYNDAALSHYWKLENVSPDKGTVTWTNNGTTPFNAAKFNNGVDGGTANTISYLSYTSDNIISYAQFNNGWSFNCWYNQYNNNQGTSGLYWSRVTDGTRLRQVGLDYGTAGQFLIHPFPNSGGGQTDGTFTATLTPGSWYMVTLTFGSVDGNYRLYVNGSPVGTVSFGTWGTYNLNAKVLYLMATNPGTLTPSALMDDVSIFSKVLSASEISNYYNAAPAAGTVTAISYRSLLGVGI